MRFHRAGLWRRLDPPSACRSAGTTAGGFSSLGFKDSTPVAQCAVLLPAMPAVKQVPTVLMAKGPRFTGRTGIQKPSVVTHLITGGAELYSAARRSSSASCVPYCSGTTGSAA